MSLSLLCASKASMALPCMDQEVQCVLHWFQGWSPYQKEVLLKELVEKAVPENVDTLFDAMNELNVGDKPPSIFKCQMKLFDQWFQAWPIEERNFFFLRLEQIDAEFVSRVNQNIAEKRGQR